VVSFADDYASVDIAHTKTAKTTCCDCVAAGPFTVGLEARMLELGHGHDFVTLVKMHVPAKTQSELSR
jgi:hypothetical protein